MQRARIFFHLLRIEWKTISNFRSRKSEREVLEKAKFDIEWEGINKRILLFMLLVIEESFESIKIQTEFLFVIFLFKILNCFFLHNISSLLLNIVSYIIFFFN